MTISDQDQATIQRWSGPIEDSVAAEAALTRLGRAEVVALEVLQTRLATLLSEPIQQTADNDGSWNSTANIKGLERTIDRLAGLCARLPGLSAEAQALVDFLAGSVGQPVPVAQASSYEVANDRPG